MQSSGQKCPCNAARERYKPFDCIILIEDVFNMSIPKQPTIPPQEGKTVYTVLKAIYDDNRNVIDCEVVAVCRSEKKAKSLITGFGFCIKESRLV